MKLGLVLGYWGASPPADAVERRKSPRSSDSTRSGSPNRGATMPSPTAAHLAAHTSRIKIGTGVVQIAARTPTATAMAAVTLDHLSGGTARPRPRRVGPTGRRGLVRVPFEATPRAHARVRGDHPACAPTRRTADLRGCPLPAAVHRRGFERAGQAAQDHDAPAARRSADLSRCRGTEGTWPRPPRSPTGGFLSTIRRSARRSTPTSWRERRRLRDQCPGDFRSQRRRRRSAPVRSGLAWPSTSGAWAPRARTTTPGSWPGWASRRRPTGSRTSSSRAEREEAIAAVPEQFADEISLVGPPDRIRQATRGVGRRVPSRRSWSRAPAGTSSGSPGTSSSTDDEGGPALRAASRRSPGRCAPRRRSSARGGWEGTRLDP